MAMTMAMGCFAVRPSRHLSHAVDVGVAGSSMVGVVLLGLSELLWLWQSWPVRTALGATVSQAAPPPVAIRHLS